MVVRKPHYNRLVYNFCVVVKRFQSRRRMTQLSMLL